MTVDAKRSGVSEIIEQSIREAKVVASLRGDDGGGAAADQSREESESSSSGSAPDS